MKTLRQHYARNTSAMFGQILSRFHLVKGGRFFAINAVI
ncbi:hypothetical protein Fbal_2104 [Ferrimonas balearica DSM 9799]|uniref:Uncharacterized protein n=1 Tax=Ferrimonas balearica (strain DSM 9799 / CCM 4581 / KCTC 23876 / PAT) TaxID=550540 RepID=E1SUY0_FERBD|nr:hypothetical protein Fbal_2104 [Ferrimonas balearica DSM 9799]